MTAPVNDDKRTNNTMTKYTIDSFGHRFEMAMKEIRFSGIVAKRNVPGCCRSCASGEFNIADDQPIIWHYGGQGNRIMIEDDGIFEYTCEAGGYSFATGNKLSGMAWPGKAYSSIYLNHDNLTDAQGLTLAGQEVVRVFQKYGIVISWDQTGSKCIEILVDASVADKYDYTTDQTLAFV